MVRSSDVLARVGLALLNVPAPGTGLLRLGRLKTALVFYLLALLALVFLRAAPPVPFALLAIVAMLAIVVPLTAIVLTWRQSRERLESRPWYARWHAVLAAALAMLIVRVVIGDPNKVAYRSFYMPSEAMAPSLPKHDRFIAYMGSLGPLRRGDLVLVRTPADFIYVKRVAAMGGDHFAMRAGVVILNGRPVLQRPLGQEKHLDAFDEAPARRLAERFPGETSGHEIYDLGPSAGDDVPEQLIPAGHLILLGDNRDRSADSRYSIEEFGLGGAVQEADIIGRPYYSSWGSTRPLGTPLAP
ncbi:signal peptidase I [Sphingomonas sp. LY54]|uniref:signal peptidase I n=1 Tax=Sphingomonas sp. LY54 TaxID=3095343 RepID=UPI002D7A0EEB|nr:signal peptidase I [Sphingomonas sp. LY54]WRP28976.1 signal peptidase I [Sphingomonas sp. LY54]